MVFVDLMKEMPITLMTRPSDWTLSRCEFMPLPWKGRFQQTALPAALVIILAGTAARDFVFKETNVT